MCPPVIAAIAAGAALLSTAASVTGSVLQGNAQASASEAQAKQAEENKRLAAIAEQDVLRQGSSDAAAVRAAGRQMYGTQRVALAASGFDIDSGTAGDLYQATE